MTFNEESDYFKARVVILGHTDPEKARAVNEAPTVLKSSVLLLLTLILSFEFPLWLRVTPLAFLQSKEKLKMGCVCTTPKR